MDNLKDRMYNFEVTPPAGVWENIEAALDGSAAVVPMTVHKSNRKLYFLAAAACIAALIFSVTWFFSKKNDHSKEYVVLPVSKNDTSKEIADNTEKITAPLKTVTVTEKNYKPNGTGKNNTQKNTLRRSENTSNEKNAGHVAENSNSYITIAGPEGQPVKVSSKVASLIESSDNSYPPKPVWNKKINKWKDIMKANTLTPTTGNFLDIVDLTNSLKEK